MTLKSVIAVFLLSLMFGTGCVRRAVTQDFGLPGIISPPRAKPRPVQSLDASVRSVFTKQTQAAPNPPKATLDQFKEAVAQLPDTGAATANAWNKMGLVYEDLAKLSEGQDAFEHAIAANPQSDSAHNNLGYNLLLQSRVDAAESEFRKALDLNPSSATARNNLAIVLARRGDLRGALEQFLMTADPATAHNNLAVVLLESGEYEKSRQQLVEALTIRHYFAPALANFKLVQERIREEADVKKYGRLPLNPVRPPSSLVALGQMTTEVSEDKK